MRPTLIFLLAAASTVAAADPKDGLAKLAHLDLGDKVKDSVQAKLLDKPLAKLDAAKDALLGDKKSLPALPDPRTVVQKDGGVRMCTPTTTKKLITMGQEVNGEYFGVMRTIDGSGGGYVYFPFSELNPAALPSNGATVKPACAARGLKASIAYAPNPDIPTIHHRLGKYYMISHRENAPGGMDLTRLDVDKKGDLTVVETQDVDFSKDGGIWFPCAGVVTPFGDAHLGSEEFEPDCKYPAELANGERSNDLLGGPVTSGVVGQVAQWSVYQNLWPSPQDSPGACLSSPPLAGVADTTPGPTSDSPPTVVYTPPLTQYTCYQYGWTPEASPTPALASVGGPAAKTKKWFTLGRLSHEVSSFMDERTLLLADDRIAGILGLFVADKKGDLSSGSLWAARLSNQVDGNGTTGLGTEWDVAWMRLGHGTQGKLASLLPTVQFSDMWETANVTGQGTAAACPAGFTLVVTVMSGSTLYLAAGPPPPTPTTKDNGRYLECLKLKPGMQDVAAFFETRRLAAYLGATNEFEKLEGVTVNPVTKKAYAASARSAAGATAGTAQNPAFQYDLESADQMRLPPNRCGVVFELDLGADARPVKMRVVLAGEQVGSLTSSRGECRDDNIAGPDNVHVIPGTSTLLITEDVDPDRGHFNTFLWAYDTLRPQRGLTRIGVAPYDAEITGIYTNFVGEHAYLMYAVQHPAGVAANGSQLPDTTTLDYPGPGNIGYIGPIPAVSLTGVHAPALQAAAIEKATGKHFSPEWLVWKEAKKLQEVTFEPVPYASPGNADFNRIQQQTTGGVCAGPGLV